MLNIDINISSKYHKIKVFEKSQEINPIDGTDSTSG